MIRCPWLLAMSLVASLSLAVGSARAEGNGQADFDEALRVKVTAEDMRDLNKVVELLESAIEKGLDVENNDFAEEMLVESLMQRAAQLAAVIQAAPPGRLDDGDLQKVRAGGDRSATSGGVRQRSGPGEGVAGSTADDAGRRSEGVLSCWTMCSTMRLLTPCRRRCGRSRW